MRLVLALLPLIAFYVVESWYGLRPAILAGVAAAAAELAWTRLADGQWRRTTLVTGALVLLLGGLSLASEDPAWVLLSPALGDVAIALLLGAVQLRGGNVLLTALREQDPEAEDPHPLQRRFLDGLVWRLAANLLAHAALVGWAAGREREVWLLVSGPVQYGMLGAQMALEVAWARLVVLPQVDAEERREA